jgi:Uma2 family endonuclease
VTQKVAPQGRHSRLQWKLAAWIGSFAEPRELAMAFTELRTTYSNSAVVPDIAVYLWDRIDWDPNGDVPDVFTTPPDIAVEIRSPGRPVRDAIERCQWYVAHGVQLALAVDPDRRTVEEYRPEAHRGPLQAADEIDFGPVLPGLRLAVDELFGWMNRARRRVRLEEPGAE